MIHDVNTNKADSLPPIEYEEVGFDMPVDTRTYYDNMRRDMLLEGSSDVVAVNMAVLSSKLRQISSGFAITEDESIVEFDTQRAKTLVSLLNEQPERPALIIYEYTKQREQIEAELEQNGSRYISVFGGSDKHEAIEGFKAGKYQYLIAQQNTLSHGTDGLQYACDHIIFFHPLWSNDNTIQSIGRVWRQGQTKPVTCTTLVCEDTVDDLVLARLDGKAEHMSVFLKHLRG